MTTASESRRTRNRWRWDGMTEKGKRDGMAWSTGMEKDKQYLFLANLNACVIAPEEGQPWWSFNVNKMSPGTTPDSSGRQIL